MFNNELVGPWSWSLRNRWAFERNQRASDSIVTNTSSFPTVGSRNWGAGPACAPHTPTALDYEEPINCEVPRLSFTLALRTGVSSRNVGKKSFFATKLSTREQSVTFHNVMHVVQSMSTRTFYKATTNCMVFFCLQVKLHAGRRFILYHRKWSPEMTTNRKLCYRATGQI